MQQYFISIHFGDWMAIAREAHKRLQEEQERLALIKKEK
jgi:hypothetical protein